MDQYRSLPPGNPAPYGHACANCVQSKCKCIIRHVGGPCERCCRIKKECRPAEKVRRRSSRKPAVSKTARLEEKLDDLVSLFKAAAHSGAVVTSPHATATVGDSMPYGIVRIDTNNPTHNQSERGSVSSSTNNHIHKAPVLSPATNDHTGSSSSLSPFGFRDEAGEPSLVEAEEYLINFQTYKSKYSPFIHIPSSTRAQQLQQEWPFLWLCIMAVGSKSTSQQQVLGSKIRQHIAQKLVVQSEKNIDLLLGLLAFISWAHYQIHSKPFLAVFTQLAMSLVFELGLNKPVLKDAQVVLCVQEKNPKPLTPRTMEERRAVLGCFLVTSIVSSFLQKIDALRWTPHMDECLQILDERKECLNDEILVQQVRLQLIVDKMALGVMHDGAVESNEHIRGPPALYFENLYSQLQDVKNKLLSQPQINDAVALYLYSTELEIALSAAFPHTNQLTLQQRKALNTGLKSMKSWFDVFFTITPAAYIGFSFSIFSQLARCIRCLMTLYQLTTLNDLSWDEDGVWKPADVLLILDRVTENLEQVAILAGLDNSNSLDRDVFSRTAQMFRSLRPAWEINLSSDDLLTTSVAQNINETFLISQNANEVFSPDALSAEFSDNDWLMDLLLSPNY